MTKSITSAFLIPIILLALSGCAGVYVGGGAGYNMTAAEAAAFKGSTGETVIYPNLKAGAGYCVELGSASSEGTAQISFTSSGHKGTYSSQEFSVSYNSLALGGRLFIEGLDIFFRPFIAANISYQRLAVEKGAWYGSTREEAVFSGFGADAGLGAMTPLGDSFLLNTEILFRFNSYGNAAGKRSSGRLNDGVLSMGPVIKAGLYFVME